MFVANFICIVQPRVICTTTVKHIFVCIFKNQMELKEGTKSAASREAMAGTGRTGKKGSKKIHKTTPTERWQICTDLRRVQRTGRWQSTTTKSRKKNRTRTDSQQAWAVGSRVTRCWLGRRVAHSQRNCCLCMESCCWWGACATLQICLPLLLLLLLLHFYETNLDNSNGAVRQLKKMHKKLQE